MQIIKKRESTGNILFATGVLIELLVMVAGHSSFINIPFAGRLTHVAFLLFGIKILMTHYTVCQWAVMLLAGGLGAISYVACGDEYVVRAVVFIFATKGIQIRKVLQMILYVMLVGTAIIAIVAILGISGDVKEVADFGRGRVETRYVFGFNHANNFHDVLWYLLSIALLLFYKKWLWKEYIMATVGNIVAYILTASRNGFIAIQLLIVACFAICYFPKLSKSRIPYVLGGFGVVVCLWMTWLGGKYGAVNSKLAAFFDRFLNNRLEMIWEYAPMSSWEFFPGARELYYVDNGFASLFYSYGWVVGVAYIVLVSYMLYRLYKNRDSVSLIVLVTAIFVTFIETTFIFNTSLLCNMIFVIMMNCWDNTQEA